MLTPGIIGIIVTLVVSALGEWRGQGIGRGPSAESTNRPCRDIAFSPGRDLGRVTVGVGEQDRPSLQRAAPVASGEADGLPAQKKSLHASERATEENRRRREGFVATLRAPAGE